MARNTRTFSDIDLNFTAHPVTKDLARKFDEESIKQAVKILVLTSNYERPFHSELGSQLRGLLFEPITPMLNILIKRAIIDVITNHEPRVRLIEVLVRFSPDHNDVYVSIEFTIVNTMRPIQIELVLTRTR